MSEPVRAMRTTDNILNDLDQLALTANDEIVYLTDAVTHHDGDLRRRMQAKLERLTRARDWLVRKVAAERQKRAEAGVDA